MNKTAWALAGVSTLLASAAFAANTPDTVLYQPPGSWVLAPPSDPVSPGAADSAVQFAYIDTQVRIAPDGTEDDYSTYRVKILKPEALSAGNLTTSWQPDDGPLTIHSVKVIRGAQTIDVLATTKFTVLQREEQLEQSMLTGQRTATLQIPGLQVGDEIVFALTNRHRKAVFAGHVANLNQLPFMGMPGTFRFRLLWPSDRKLTWHVTRDLPSPKPVTHGTESAIEITLHDPKGAIPTEGAPLRYNVRRLVEFSDFGDWADISRLMAPLFKRAATLEANSPIKGEVAAIAARTQDPAERAQAALQLVEDRIRYVFVGLDGGDYTPASADDTWKRRFGDCKAKTALLIAILHELRIEAEPALVNSKGGDGTDQRLPSPSVFDHVIVRATIGGKTQWLDGTRLGDKYLDNLPQPYLWALPLTDTGAGLEKLVPRDYALPQFTGVLDIDATAGLDKDAHISARHIIRGDQAYLIRTQLAALTADDADRALKTYWRQQVDWTTPDTVAWSYDERRMAITLSLTGRGNPGWKGDSQKGHNLSISGAGFFAPDPMRRPSDQDQSAPWAVEYPRFRCWATTIHLPKAASPLAWSLYADPMNRRLGGVIFWRASGMRDNIVRTVMSSRSAEMEATSQEAAIVNAAIPDFNNNMSNIGEESAGDVLKSSTTLPFDDNVDWLNAPKPCFADPATMKAGADG